MGVAVMTVLALAILKALAGKIYAECKIGIWLTVVTVVVLAGWLLPSLRHWRQTKRAARAAPCLTAFQLSSVDWFYRKFCYQF